MHTKKSMEDLLNETVNDGKGVTNDVKTERSAPDLGSSAEVYVDVDVDVELEAVTHYTKESIELNFDDDEMNIDDESAQAISASNLSPIKIIDHDHEDTCADNGRKDDNP